MLQKSTLCKHFHLWTSSINSFWRKISFILSSCWSFVVLCVFVVFCRELQQFERRPVQAVACNFSLKVTHNWRCELGPQFSNWVLSILAVVCYTEWTKYQKIDNLWYQNFQYFLLQSLDLTNWDIQINEIRSKTVCGPNVVTWITSREVLKKTRCAFWIFTLAFCYFDEKNLCLMKSVLNPRSLPAVAKST